MYNNISFAHTSFCMITTVNLITLCFIKNKYMFCITFYLYMNNIA